MTYITPRALLSFPALLVAVALFGCRPSSSVPPGTGGAPAVSRPRVAETSEQVPVAGRDYSVKAPDEDIKAVVDGNTAFAADLYQRLAADPGNVFFAPHSVSIALAMTYAGARGETEQEMAKVLHFTLPQDRLHPALGALDIAVQAPQIPSRASLPGIRIDSANSIWVQTGYDLLPTFTDIIGRDYGGQAQMIDFASNPDAAAREINQWVLDRTEKRIQDLIPPGALSRMTRLVLANAVYFLGKWDQKFKVESTKPGPFTKLDGNKVEAQMMFQDGQFSYASDDLCQIVSLPYTGYRASMVIVLPRAGAFAEVESGLTAERISGLLSTAKGADVKLTMPRFTFTVPYTLGDTLQAMGMKLAFGAADFSGMTGGPDLYISEVRHKAFVSVDEEGTEAAAATDVEMKAGSAYMPSEPMEFTADRPFIFLIRDIQSGTILFMGRVVDPTVS